MSRLRAGLPVLLAVAAALAALVLLVLGCTIVIGDRNSIGQDVDTNTRARLGVQDELIPEKAGKEGKGGSKAGP